MWLFVFNLAFVAGGACLYWIAHRMMLRNHGGGRDMELLACLLTAFLTIGGFALAHIGMNDSWTGHALVTDLQWLGFALVFATALLGAHSLLRLQGSRVDQMLLPVAAFLVALGLINIYVWEARDANAYISTVALPTMREYRETITEDPALSRDQRTEILQILGTVPNELEYESSIQSGFGNRFATVLNDQWLGAYNESVGRFKASLAAHRLEEDAPPVREVHLYDVVRRQLLVASVSLLMLPGVLFAISRMRLPALAGRRWPLFGVGLPLLAIAGATVLTSGGRSMPALLGLGGQSVVSYEVLKVGLVILLALSLGQVMSSRSKRGRAAVVFGFAAAGATIATMAWLDPGAGVALLGIGVLMFALVLKRRWLYWLMVGAVFSILAVPAVVGHLDSNLPETVPARLQMWADPWGSFDRAEVDNQVGWSLGRIISHRLDQQPVSLVSAAEAEHRLVLASLIESDVRHIEQELRWRLEGLQSDAPNRAKPFIPMADPVEELVLLEAEDLWSGLGGYRQGQAPASDERMLSFEARIDQAISRLQIGADRFVSEISSEGNLDGQSLARLRSVYTSSNVAEPDNFQLQRSWFALREGGPLGVGLGLGRPEALPGVTEDVALAALGEALGFAGVALIVLLILLITTRGIELGRGQSRPTLGLLIVGLSSLFGLQALIGIGGMLGILPFTGLTFPFISRSGTSLLANFFALSLILSISKRGEADRGWYLYRHSGDVQWFEEAPRPESNLPVMSPRDWATLPLRGAGFPAAFIVLLASVASLQLTGHTLMPNAIFAELPSPSAPSLHATDQWDGPSYRMIPGPIVDRHGLVLAETLSLGGSRVYPDPELATSLGHTLTRLDLAFSQELLQRTKDLPVLDGMARSNTGPVLVTTIDSEIQRAVHGATDQGAREAGLPDVNGIRAAVVVLDATSGEILALESRPTFSLTELSDPLVWVRAEANDRRSGFPHRYLNRVIDGHYPPGSTFKTITAAAALENGLHTLDSRDFDYRSGSKSARPSDGLEHFSLWHRLSLPDGPPITDSNHPHLWRFNLEEAFAWSSNVAFAEIGLEVGAADLVSLAHRFGFERQIDVRGLGTSMSPLDDDYDKDLASRYLARTTSNLARTAFGQGQLQSTPLQMALVAAGIAHQGEIMQPHVVAGWKSHDARWLEKAAPRIFSDTGLSGQTLEDLQEMMRASATYGWASRAKLNSDNSDPGVAGKTGSAEWKEGPHSPHAWFIGYFPAESPRVAVAVLVERGGSGSTVAVPIARHIFASDAVQEYVAEASPR